MPLILPGNVGSATAATGYNVANSLRFNAGDSPELSFTVDGTPTHQDKGTWSFWIKRGNILGAVVRIFSAYAGGGATQTWIRFDADDKLDIANRVSSSFNTRLVTNRVFRDPSAWYHVVIAFDSSQGTDSNRVKLYVNGVQETSFATGTYPSQNDDLEANTNGIPLTWGAEGVNNDEYFDGYIAETVFIDGQQLAADQFGEFDSDSGIWKPIDVSGLTFGTNGYFLEFKESGTSANASGMGADTSGNTHHFAVNNLTAIDQGTSTCTNDFATLNVLDGVIVLGNSTFSEGNLRFNSETNGNKCWARSTIGVSSGKWYFEAQVQTAGNNCEIGITDRPSANLTNELGGRAFEYSYQSANSGNKLNNGSGSSYGDTYTDDDIVSCALDLDNLKIYFGKNGTFQNSGDPTSGATGTGAAFTITAPSLTITGFYFFALGDLSGASNTRWLANFGSAAPFTISSGNTDGNGYGNFEYAVPSGYYALNTKNLAEFG